MKTHEKKYHNATFYRKMGISITILIRELGAGFGADIKHILISPKFSENVYHEFQIIEEVKKLTKNKRIKTLNDAGREMNLFCKEKLKKQIKDAVKKNIKQQKENKQRKKQLKTSDVILKIKHNKQKNRKTTNDCAIIK